MKHYQSRRRAAARHVRARLGAVQSAGAKDSQIPAVAVEQSSSRSVQEVVEAKNRPAGEHGSDRRAADQAGAGERVAADLERRARSPSDDPDLDLAEDPSDRRTRSPSPMRAADSGTTDISSRRRRAEETVRRPRADLAPRPAASNYPPCGPGPGDDNCIQLYEPGVRTALASWNQPTGGLAQPGEAMARPRPRRLDRDGRPL